MVNDPNLLINPTICQSECLNAATDSSVLWISQHRSVDIQVVALSVVSSFILLNVHCAENLERKIVSYKLLEAKNGVINNLGGRRVLTSGRRKVLPSCMRSVAATCRLLM